MTITHKLFQLKAIATLLQMVDWKLPFGWKISSICASNIKLFISQPWWKLIKVFYMNSIQDNLTHRIKVTLTRMG